MDSIEESLNDILNRFVELVKGNHSKVSTNSWINRYKHGTFSSLQRYHGIVESICNRHAGVIVIAKMENGLPLNPHEVTKSERIDFGRVLLLVNHLRPSQIEPAYSKETVIYDVLQEGEVVAVEIRQCFQSPNNIFPYWAETGVKVGEKVNEGTLSTIKDPLRGIVDRVINPQVGIIRFETYEGRITEAILKCENLYLKGEKLNEMLPLASFAPENSLVFLEVRKWESLELKQQWEKELHEAGVLFYAQVVWMKDDLRPSKISSFKTSHKTRSCHAPTVQTQDAPVNNASRNTLLPSQHADNGSLSIGCCKVYYGRVETFTSSISAVVCTAHRNGKPLTLKDDWCAEGVNLERAFLIAKHIQPSENQPPYKNGTKIREILKREDPLKIMLKPTRKVQHNCYKWFVTTCWKVDEEESEVCAIPMNRLPGHLSGVVDSWINHKVGIIKFKTYHGMSAKAFFYHDNFYQNGKKITKHFPLDSKVPTETEVFLVVDKLNPGNNPNEFDQAMIQNHVCFRAVVVWNKGSLKPDEEISNITKELEGLSAFENQYQKTFSQRSGQIEKELSLNQQETYLSCTENAGNSETFTRERKYFASARGLRRRNGRWRGRVGHHGRQQNAERCSYDSDCNSADESDGNASDVSNQSVFFSGDDSAKKEQLKDVNKGSHLKKSKLSKTSNGLSKSISGTLISVDEHWGMVKVNDKNIHFQSDVVYLYGFCIKDLPLQNILRRDQVVLVRLEGEMVKVLEYGTPQRPIEMKKAVHIYCKKNSIPSDVMELLEASMQRYFNSL